MKLSTRARYGMRLMLVLAQHYGEKPVFLKDIAKSEEISEKYLSLIMIPLRASGLVNSSRGAYGGYSLGREPDRINLKEVMDVLEGDSCLVDCVKDPSVCRRVSTCVSRDVWSIIGERIADTLRGMTLADLVGKTRARADGEIMSNI
jgi:Rrf2 family protein